MKKNICIVTGTRAEWGLFCPLAREIRKYKNLFNLQIAVTGMHIVPRFGLTYKEIEKDGFHIDRKVKMLFPGDTPEAIAKSMGRGVAEFAQVLPQMKPDFVILLGDRFETFSAAIAAFIGRIPIFHFYGGELTEGLIDDAMRHSITKMSVLHFVATPEYKRRVIQLGESPDRIFVIGALGIDNIKNIRLFSKAELEKKLKFKFGKKTAIVTFHPVTLEKQTTESQFRNLLKALDRSDDLNIIFTKPNADTEGRVISELVDEYVNKNRRRAVSFISMGQKAYLSAMKYADVVIGNSSSGIIETPSFKKPTVNIGDRQRGRLRAKSVIDCAPSENQILAAIKKATSRKFINICRNVRNPYGDGNAAVRAVSIIKNQIGRINGVKKAFYDIKNG